MSIINSQHLTPRPVQTSELVVASETCIRRQRRAGDICGILARGGLWSASSLCWHTQGGATAVQPTGIEPHPCSLIPALGRMELFPGSDLETPEMNLQAHFAQQRGLWQMQAESRVFRRQSLCASRAGINLGASQQLWKLLGEVLVLDGVSLWCRSPELAPLAFLALFLHCSLCKCSFSNCPHALLVLEGACCVRVQPGLAIVSNLSKQQSYFSFSNSFSGASWDVRLCSGCCCSKDTTACSLKQSFLFLLELSSLFLCTFGENSSSFS